MIFPYTNTEKNYIVKLQLDVLCCLSRSFILDYRQAFPIFR